MSYTTFGTIVLSAMLLAGCANPVKPAHGEYSGSGGMTQWNIDPIVYLYHYQHGFTGSDALGYDEQLQTVWSRLGAAVTCNIRYNKQDMIQRLIQRFGEKAITHELNSIGFHSVQSRKVPDFCNRSRVKKITSALQRYRRGQFD